MTRDEAKQLLRNLPALRAWADGKGVEYLYGPSGWGDCESPSFTSPPEFYRIKPEPVECWAVVDAGGVVIRSYNHQSNAADYAATSHNFRVARLREVT